MFGGRVSLSLVAVPVLAVLGCVQWWVGSAPVAMVVAGYVALVGALSHPLPLRLALSAAFLLQNATYLVLMLVLPLLTSGGIRPGVALAVLAVPCVAVVPDVVLRRRARTQPDRAPGRRSSSSAAPRSVGS